jgi:hypothetical protein
MYVVEGVMETLSVFLRSLQMSSHAMLWLVRRNILAVLMDVLVLLEASFKFLENP